MTLHFIYINVCMYLIVLFSRADDQHLSCQRLFAGDQKASFLSRCVFLIMLCRVLRRGSGLRPLRRGPVQADPRQSGVRRSQWPSGRHPLPKPQHLRHRVLGENPSSRRWNNIQYQEPATVSVETPEYSAACSLSPRCTFQWEFRVLLLGS